MKALVIALALLALVGCADTYIMVPVAMTQRTSYVGQGRVLVLSNQTPSQLTVRVEVVRGGKTVNLGAMSIRANSSREIGWYEGWAFQDGDTVTVYHQSYLPRTETFK